MMALPTVGQIKNVCFTLMEEKRAHHTAPPLSSFDAYKRTGFDALTVEEVGVYFKAFSIHGFC